MEEIVSKLKFGFPIYGVFIAVALTGCGGGDGGNSAPPATTTSFPVQQAVQYAYTHGMQQTLSVSGTGSNGSSIVPVTGSLSFTLGAATTATFEGMSGFQSPTTINGTLVVNNQTEPFGATAVNYLNAQYQPIGNSATGQYCVATTVNPYPTTATSGMTGQLGTFNCYTDSSKSTRTGTQATSYVTNADTGNMLDVQLITNIYGTSNQLIATSSTTYSITTAGVPTLKQFSISTTQNGVTLNLTAQ